MLLNRKNNEETKTRIVNLDFLRGLFIILALDQHFTYYINMWYVEFFRDSIALTSTYKIHFPMIGKIISTDHINYLLGVIFTPWVSQVYLTLATFNLAKTEQALFREQLRQKLKIFFLIFAFFAFENFIVAPNTGQAISFYPIMLWMIIMSVLALVYSYTGIKGIVFLFFASFLRWIFPVEVLSNFFQSVMINKVHPGFEYDARIEYFFTSGCLGFIMGHIHYHRPQLSAMKDLYFIVLGLVLIGLYAFYGAPILIDPADAFAHEHDLAQSLSGLLYILGVQASVISLFLWLEKKAVRFNVPVVTWVGMNSILVFAFHRIFFVRVLAPLSILIGGLYGRTIGASLFEVYSYVGTTILFCYFIKHSNIEKIILSRKN